MAERAAVRASARDEAVDALEKLAKLLDPIPRCDR